MIDKTTTTSTANDQPPRQRLKKDGTPDRRNGNPGNAGNKHATGRKKIAGQETRKLISFVATDPEYKLLLQYATILKDNYDRGIDILSSLGTPPDGRAKMDSDRTKRTIRVYESEKTPIRQMLAIIKDRYDAAYMIISRN